MLEALQILRLWPRQIASDLARFWPRWCIADWHQGRMSSFTLLELFGIDYVDVVEDGQTRKLVDPKFAPEQGAVAKTVRDGDWPEWVAILAEIHKEQAIFHASHYRRSDKRYKATVFQSPVERRKRHEQAVVDARDLEESEQSFYAQQGWT